MRSRIEVCKRHRLIFPKLSQAEHEVLLAICFGNDRLEIASIFNRSPRTIDNHRASILRKLKLHTLSKLMVHAFRFGYVQADELPDSFHEETGEPRWENPTVNELEHAK